jgi:hypothetical protein
VLSSTEYIRAAVGGNSFEGTLEHGVRLKSQVGRLVQVHVALVKEWDDDFQQEKARRAGDSAQTANGSTSGAVERRINLVFAFRGTEPWNACNWLADFDYEWRSVTWWHTSVEVRPLYPLFRILTFASCSLQHSCTFPTLSR